jgi:hypothetical protein
MLAKGIKALVLEEIEKMNGEERVQGKINPFGTATFLITKDTTEEASGVKEKAENGKLAIYEVVDSEGQQYLVHSSTEEEMLA